MLKPPHGPTCAGPSALTFSVQGVVPWEHNATAHDVPFEAAGAKRVSNAATVEDLPVICREDKDHAVGLLGSSEPI